jgi:hypothetical protein
MRLSRSAAAWPASLRVLELAAGQLVGAPRTVFSMLLCLRCGRYHPITPRPLSRLYGQELGLGSSRLRLRLRLRQGTGGGGSKTALILLAAAWLSMEEVVIW